MDLRKILTTTCFTGLLTLAPVGASIELKPGPIDTTQYMNEDCQRNDSELYNNINCLYTYATILTLGVGVIGSIIDKRRKIISN